MFTNCFYQVILKKKERTMKKEEKTRISRERILQAAIREFGKNSYSSGSMNSICEDNGLSKGLIYHNFRNKDDLYLCALKRCVDDLNGYISEGDYDDSSMESKALCILNRRIEFFATNHSYKILFFYSFYEPPKSLSKEISEIHKEYVKTIVDLLSCFKFRNGKSNDFILEYFNLSAGMIVRYTKDNIPDGMDINEIAEEHDKNLKIFIDTIFFGVAEKE